MINLVYALFEPWDFYNRITAHDKPAADTSLTSAIIEQHRQFTISC